MFATIVTVATIATSSTSLLYLQYTGNGTVVTIATVATIATFGMLVPNVRYNRYSRYNRYLYYVYVITKIHPKKLSVQSLHVVSPCYCQEGFKKDSTIIFFSPLRDTTLEPSRLTSRQTQIVFPRIVYKTAVLTESKQIWRKRLLPHCKLS